ncbi:MAG: MBL fold metallo-hydrolase [Bacteroidales bacterium]|nr:MBL fold metallo-hydrolase [Bacteroidales bacterium]
MKIKFLGTGTSLGVPIVNCHCPVCTSGDPRDKRLRSSVLVEEKEHFIIIDTGPDFRAQCIANNVQRIDAVLITHPHRDHLAGLDDIRPFCFIQEQNIPIYASSYTGAAIRRDFAYCFAEPKYPGVPEIHLQEFEHYKKFSAAGIDILPFPVHHAQMVVTAYRIGNFTYITDAGQIDDEAIRVIEGSEYLVVNALRKEPPHAAHFTLPQALDLIAHIKPREAYITHISHMIPHAATERELPPHVHLAYDGLTLQF